MKGHLHCEDRDLRDPGDHRGEGQDEDEQPKVDVDRKVEGTESRGEAGGEEGHEAADPLREEEDDADDADPGVEAVHVGDGRLPEVVVVEDRLQPDDHERQRRAHDDRVGQLDLFLVHVQGSQHAKCVLVEENAVDDDSWKYMGKSDSCKVYQAMLMDFCLF